MSGYVIQPTGDPPFVTCKTCSGRGYVTALKWGVDPDWCPECGGAKEIALDMSALATLAHNLAIGGVLCASFDLAVQSCFTHCDHWYGADDWKPGCGKAAP